MLMRCWSVGLKFIIRPPVSQLGFDQCHPPGHNQCHNQSQLGGTTCGASSLHQVVLPWSQLGHPYHNQRWTQTQNIARVANAVHSLFSGCIGRSVLMFTKGCVCVDSISNVNSQLQFQNIKCLTNLSKFYFFLQFCQSCKKMPNIVKL